MRWHVAPVPQFAPICVSTQPRDCHGKVITSSARDCSLGSSVVEGLVEDDDTRRGVSQPCSQLVDVFRVLGCRAATCGRQ